MKSKRAKKTGERPASRVKPSRQLLLPEEFHEQIAKRAFEIYERRNCQGALDDWLQAEQEILGQENARKVHNPHRGGYASEEQD
jgi:Protein of unknown function (DUF2934)